MVTVTPFMGKLKVRNRQFYVNENGEKKPGKNGITHWNLKNLMQWLGLFHKSRRALQGMSCETLEPPQVHLK